MDAANLAICFGPTMVSAGQRGREGGSERQRDRETGRDIVEDGFFFHFYPFCPARHGDRGGCESNWLVWQPRVAAESTQTSVCEKLLIRLTLTCG